MYCLRLQGQDSPPTVFRNIGNYLQVDMAELPPLQLAFRQLRGFPVRYTCETDRLLFLHTDIIL